MLLHNGPMLPQLDPFESTQEDVCQDREEDQHSTAVEGACVLWHIIKYTTEDNGDDGVTSNG